MKKRLFHLVCWLVALALLAYLFWRARRGGLGLLDLRIEPASWRLLLAASLLTATASIVSFLRWRLLVLALNIDFRLIRALQLGFLAELLNYLAFGVVGGDLAKVVFIARGQPGRRIQAASTVLVDRLAGLYALFLLASVAILACGLWRTASGPIRAVCGATLLAMLIGTCGLLLVVALSPQAGALARHMGKLPYVGERAIQVVDALAQYRRRLRVLAIAVAMGLAVHSLAAVAVYMIALAVTANPPSLGRHLVITPLATSSAALPLPAQGLGAFEWVLDTLYLEMSPGTRPRIGQGLLVALAYRLVTLAVAAVGASVCFAIQPSAGRDLREAAATRDP